MSTIVPVASLHTTGTPGSNPSGPPTTTERSTLPASTAASLPVSVAGAGASIDASVAASAGTVASTDPASVDGASGPAASGPAASCAVESVDASTPVAGLLLLEQATDRSGKARRAWRERMHDSIAKVGLGRRTKLQSQAG
jgi:hypothetical protein